MVVGHAFLESTWVPIRKCTRGDDSEIIRTHSGTISPVSDAIGACKFREIVKRETNVTDSCVVGQEAAVFFFFGITVRTGQPAYLGVGSF